MSAADDPRLRPSVVGNEFMIFKQIDTPLWLEHVVYSGPIVVSPTPYRAVRDFHDVRFVCLIQLHALSRK